MNQVWPSKKTTPDKHGIAKSKGKFIWIKYFVILLLICLLCFAAFLFGESQYPKNNNNDNYVVENIIERGIEQYKSEGARLKNLSVKDEENNELRLFDLIKDTCLVFRYTDLNCDVCVEKSIEFINSYLEKIGTSNILVLSSYDNPRDLYTFKRLNKLKFKIYNLSNSKYLGLPIDELNVPYFFILAPDGLINCLYIPEKSMPQQSASYFETVYARYFSNN
jgi:peroxiredoxin